MRHVMIRKNFRGSRNDTRGHHVSGCCVLPDFGALELQSHWVKKIGKVYAVIRGTFHTRIVVINENEGPIVYIYIHIYIYICTFVSIHLSMTSP